MSDSQFWKQVEISNNRMCWLLVGLAVVAPVMQFFREDLIKFFG